MTYKKAIVEAAQIVRQAIREDPKWDYVERDLANEIAANFKKGSTTVELAIIRELAKIFDGEAQSKKAS